MFSDRMQKTLNSGSRVCILANTQEALCKIVNGQAPVNLQHDPKSPAFTG